MSSTTPNSSSNLLHQFLTTDSSIPNSNQFHAHFLNAAADHQSFDQVPTIQSLGDRMSRSLDLINQPDLLLEPSNTQPPPTRIGPYASEMLSLSLSSEMLFRPIQLRQRPSFTTYLSSSSSSSIHHDQDQPKELDYYSSFPPPPSSNNNNNNNSYGVESFAGIDMISNSRYLKPTQSLLREVVCIGGETVQSSNERYFNRMSSKSRRGSLSFCSELKSDSLLLRNDSDGFQTLGKLISLLQEVERRYEQYYKELEKAVSSFEMVAGIGAGKSYTALALQAMSRHFCSLKEAITSQIMETRRKEGLRTFQEKENRLCLQQLGMMQSHRQAWRPIRGLPEVSVSILRCWLFEHFLHPYPNDNEKLTLASQTGLTKNQVSNWFINARVRLWKPMIEEMYKEEFDGDAYDSSDP
ncbi:BEL1-like homeodomain protein 11 [Impatiens glandulifera]|uniref:BEL1-like homeodomain protein 11 n=1 Tax=Impatiens glandulifera TaxID=253017 RepID=UPI001FB0AB1F|nr:BEL1-like homeodomain protein 11 [Impatiens glandulifera]